MCTCRTNAQRWKRPRLRWPSCREAAGLCPSSCSTSVIGTTNSRNRRTNWTVSSVRSRTVRMRRMIWTVVLRVPGAKFALYDWLVASVPRSVHVCKNQNAWATMSWRLPRRPRIAESRMVTVWRQTGRWDRRRSHLFSFTQHLGAHRSRTQTKSAGARAAHDAASEHVSVHLYDGGMHLLMMVELFPVWSTDRRTQTPTA